MNKTWHGYTLLDFLLIMLGLVSTIVTVIVFKSPWYLLVNIILSLLCVFTQAKGKIITQFLGVATFGFHIYISYTQRFYGEALLYLCIMMPMYLYGIIHWLMHKDKKDNVVIVRNNLSKREWIISLICLAVISIGVYFMLKALNTAQLITSTFAFISMLPAVYLLIRRCKWNQIAFLINDLIAPILWIVLVATGDLIFIPTIIYYAFQLIYDAYGIVQWQKLENRQKQDKVNLTISEDNV